MEPVATVTAKFRGRCGKCKRTIPRGQQTVKMDVGERGKQTSGGNGRGQWWCVPCATEHKEQ